MQRLTRQSTGDCNDERTPQLRLVLGIAVLRSATGALLPPYDPLITWKAILMHPPFYVVGRDATPPHHRPHVRRNRAERLDLTPPKTAWVPVPLVQPTPPVPVNVVRLQLVPPPRNTWRDTIGRWLIRAGQRMILQN